MHMLPYSILGPSPRFRCAVRMVSRGYLVMGTSVVVEVIVHQVHLCAERGRLGVVALAMRFTRTLEQRVLAPFDVRLHSRPPEQYHVCGVLQILALVDFHDRLLFPFHRSSWRFRKSQPGSWDMVTRRLTRPGAAGSQARGT